MINSFFHIAIFIVTFLTHLPGRLHGQDDSIEEPLMVLRNDIISVTIDLQGGEYIDFHLRENSVNPFTWSLSPDQMPNNNKPHVFEGHFLCTGRWGAPSEGEIEAGIPHNGEVNTQKWKVVQKINNSDNKTVTMSCMAPIEKLHVQRIVILPASGNYFIVSETFHNALPIGRTYNIVQHGTIGPPFLSKETIINTNATYGFDQRTSHLYLEDSCFVWPEGRLANGNKIDLQSVSHKESFVTTHIIEDEIGWVTAYNPSNKILLGYIWKSKEYPWINIWHDTKDGNPYAQGLEFGTTGLGKPYKLLLENHVSFYGKNSFEYIDAGQSKSKSWICFLVKCSSGFKQVEELILNENSIIIESQFENKTFEIKGDFKQFLSL